LIGESGVQASSLHLHRGGSRRQSGSGGNQATTGTAVPGNAETKVSAG
jgi:hypothetical protein